MAPTEESKPGRLVIMIPQAFVNEIDSTIMDKKIRNYQDGYRQILRLGFEQFKKTKKEAK